MKEKLNILGDSAIRVRSVRERVLRKIPFKMWKGGVSVALDGKGTNQSYFSLILNTTEKLGVKL